MAQDDLFQDPLTSREQDILRSMSEGLSNAQIAERLILAPGTIKWYLKQIYSKLDAHSRDEAVAQARRLGLVAAGTSAERPTTDAAKPRRRLINPLPIDVTGRYLGYREHVGHLTRLLTESARLIGVYGRGGAGKTALACKVLGDLLKAEMRSAPFDGVVCLSALSTGISLERVLSDLARLLDDELQLRVEAVRRSQELTLAHKIGFVLEHLLEHRVVLLLDNLETLQSPETGELLDERLQLFIEMALGQSSALTLLITSREALPLPRALLTWEHRISLDAGLGPEDAVALLRAFDPSGAAGLQQAAPEHLHVMAERTGGFPRALEAVAGILLEDPLLRLEALIADLRRLEGEISSTVVHQSLDRLGAERLAIMQALAVFERPVPYQALAFVLAPFLDEPQLRSRLAQLLRAGFVKENRAAQVFSLHPIDWAYCYAQISPGTPQDGATQPAPFTRYALHRRAADYYQLQGRPQAQWRSLADVEPQIEEIKQRVRAGDDDEAARVLLVIDRDYLWEWGERALLGTLYAMLDGQLRDARLAHHVARRQAWLTFWAAPEDADRAFEALLQNARAMGYRQEEADALDDLAQTERRTMRDLPRALELHQQALTLYRQLGDRRGMAEALGGMGAILPWTAPEQAIPLLEEAVAIQEELGHRNSLSSLHRHLGIAYEALGLAKEAVEHYQASVRIGEATRSLEALIGGLVMLGPALHSMGETAAALRALQEAVRLARDISGSAGSMALYRTLHRLGLHTGLAGQLEEGIAILRQVAQEIPPRFSFFAAMAQANLSLLLLLKGEIQEARSLMRADLVAPPFRDTVAWFGVLLLRNDERAAAGAFFTSILDAPPAGRHPILASYAAALAHAGLALLNRDPAHLTEALERYRQLVREKKVVWLIRSHLGHITGLIGSPGGALLTPLRDLLDAALAEGL